LSEIREEIDVENTVEAGNGHERAAQYKREFWGKANLSFGAPWYRLEKSAKLIAGLAGGRECSLLDVGCGPGTLMDLLPSNIKYYGVDIAIQRPAANLIESDIVESPISFGSRRFDLVSALGLFEYAGDAQSRKFAEIANLLAQDGKFVVTYTNFSHRKKRIYEAFSNVQPLDDFRHDLERYFKIDRSFPASHNWKHSQPSRQLIKKINMHVNANIPAVSRLLAVDYFFVCSTANG
jgi:cyclopropane fatty-acyl-phospholipid synthase-like methyltransferase